MSKGEREWRSCRIAQFCTPQVTPERSDVQTQPAVCSRRLAFIRPAAAFPERPVQYFTSKQTVNKDAVSWAFFLKYAEMLFYASISLKGKTLGHQILKMAMGVNLRLLPSQNCGKTVCRAKNGTSGIEQNYYFLYDSRGRDRDKCISCYCLQFECYSGAIRWSNDLGGGGGGRTRAFATRWAGSDWRMRGKKNNCPERQYKKFHLWRQHFIYWTWCTCHLASRCFSQTLLSTAPPSVDHHPFRYVERKQNTFHQQKNTVATVPHVGGP